MKILKRMIEVMKEVSKQHDVLLMGNYFEDENLISKETTMHTCNTPACIMGYCYLDPVIKKLAHIEDGDPEEEATNVWIALDREIGQNSNKISGSIANSDNRYEDARHTDLFTQKELDSFEHLKESNSNPTAAVIYMEALLKKLEMRKSHYRVLEK